MPETTRIFIADDHSIVRHGLKQCMALTPDLRVVAEAGNGAQLLSLLSSVAAEVLLLDLTMPGLSGIELIRRVAQRDAAPRILVLSMHNEAQLVSRALKAGAAGYLTKDSDPEMLFAAIRKIARGGRFIDPVLVDKLVFDHGLGDDRPLHEKLSDREFQIFQLLVAGSSVNTIAEHLSLSAKTISTHKLRLMQKMQMQSIADLTRYAIANGLIAS